MRKFLFSVLALICSTQFSRGQVLISLLLGDKLNSDKLEFGLEGGLVFSSITNMPGSDFKRGFNLGFYFDFNLKKHLQLHTGVIVKSPMGTQGLTPYPTGNEGLDTLLVNGSVKKRLSYFNVPVLLKYKMDNQLSFELGPQFGLLSHAKDQFIATVNDKDDLLYESNIKDNTHKIDMGGVIGVGYKLMKGKGMNFGARYYSGLLNVVKDNTGNAQRNTAFYLYAGIPIGVKKKTAEN